MKNEYAVRTITCEGCGEIVTKRMPSGRKYCSLVCFRKNERPECKTGIYVNCAYCGKQVYRTKSRVGNHSNFFCSLEHANSYQGRNRESFNCIMCGKEFSWSSSRSRVNNIKYCSLECRDNDPSVKEFLIKLNAKQQQQLKPNKVEIVGYSILDDLGIEYIAQQLLFNKFVVDTYVPKYNTVIQFDGEYWHGKPDKYPVLDKRQQKRVNLDKSQDAYMKKCGVNVIRFWDSEILNNIDYVKESLIEAGIC